MLDQNYTAKLLNSACGGSHRSHSRLSNASHKGRLAAGHENSKTIMDIYARVKYNKPEELFDVVNRAMEKDR